MKIHTLSKALRELANIMDSLPNMDLSDLSFPEQGRQKNDEILVNLKTLASLSKIKKKQWEELIKDYNFPIKIEKRDSARNILGKLLNYIDNNPDSVNLIKSQKRTSDTKSSVLLQALDALLEDV